jgi:RNA polymerase sigma factor (sigma-70 family)
MKKDSYLEEDNLINGIKENEEMVISYVYKKNFPVIANFIRLNGGTNDDAKDIFQEAMIILYNNLQNPEFKLVSKLNTYLYSVSRNLWLSQLRKKCNVTDSIEDVADYIQDNELTFEDIEVLNLNKRRIELSLNLLGEPCKTILSYFYFYKWSMQEIAEAMGYTNAENAKNQKYKCLLRLKKIYKSL